MENTTWIEKRMEGAGNSFAFIAFPSPEAEQEYLKLQNKNLSQISQKLCAKHQVDGTAFLKGFQDTSPHYEWDFYNADGSSAEMCGNAARCAAALCFEEGLAPKIHSFKTLAGVISAEYIQAGEVAVELSPIQASLTKQNFNEKSFSTDYYFVNSGVPHIVIPSTHLNKDDLRLMAQLLRNHELFKPQGANVSFYTVGTQNAVNAISFERGVEDFTLACGTGAVAVACVYNHLHPSEEAINVQMPGGLLKVDFSDEKPKLIGPVKYLP